MEPYELQLQQLIHSRIHQVFLYNHEDFLLLEAQDRQVLMLLSYPLLLHLQILISQLFQHFAIEFYLFLKQCHILLAYHKCQLYLLKLQERHEVTPSVYLTFYKYLLLGLFLIKIVVHHRVFLFFLLFEISVMKRHSSFKNYSANNVSGNHNAIPGNIYIKTIARITIPRKGIIPLKISIN